MTLTHTSHEFAAMTRAFAILVTALDARDKIDGRAIAANLRVTAGDLEGGKELQEFIAEMITRTIDRFEAEGPSQISIVDQSPG